MLSCLLGLLAGCGTVSIDNVPRTLGPAPQSRPEKIQVLPFVVEDCEWGLEVSSTDEALIKSSFADQMASAVVAELTPLAPASKADAGDISNAWLVQGRLHKVFLPDPTLPDSKRKPRVQCTVFVFDLNRSRVQPFLSYDIVAKDVLPDPLAEAPKPGETAFLALEAKECARLLAGSLQDYLKSRGWSQTGK
jgi:hypothetical protein